MIVVGLTGSIAMGKSSVAAMFAQCGAPVFDADTAVRDFYCGDGARAVGEIFPGALVEGRVDRERLSRLVVHDIGALNRLEALVHPVVATAHSRFVKQAAAEGRRLIVVDVPLLLEIGNQAAVDVVVVVSAAAPVQRARALARNGMSEEKLDIILSRQMNDVEKRRRSHFVIDTNGSHDETRAQLRQFLRCAAGFERRSDHHA
jgi:dephospho-CoA kinase